MNPEETGSAFEEALLADFPVPPRRPKPKTFQDVRPDLFTPAPAEMLGSLAHQVLDQAVADFRRPEFRAGFGAAVVTTALLARTRLPGIVVIPLSVMIGASVEHLYGMAADIHGKLAGDAPGQV